MQKSNMTSAAWRELEAIVSRFEEALHEQQRPQIRDFLSTEYVDQVSLLLELIAAEAEQRCRLGEPVTCSDYATAYADLLAATADLDRLAVVVAEACETISRCVPNKLATKTSTRTKRVGTPKPRDHHQLIEPLSPSPPSRSAFPG